MMICGSTHTSNGLTYVCLEDAGHTERDGTMHEAHTLTAGPVNW